MSKPLLIDGGSATWLNTPTLGRGTHQLHGVFCPQLQELTGQRNALLAKREQIEDAVIREDFDMGTFTRVSKKIEVQIADLDETMRELTASRDADPLAVELANGPDFAEWGVALLLRTNAGSPGYLWTFISCRANWGRKVSTLSA